METWKDYTNWFNYLILSNKQTFESMRESLTNMVPQGTTEDEVRAIAQSIVDNRQEWEITCLKRSNEELKIEAREAVKKANEKQDQEEKWRKGRIFEWGNFLKMSTQELHDFVSTYHWDEGDMEEVLRGVLHAPNCSKGTALLMFWKLEWYWSINEFGFERKHEKPTRPDTLEDPSHALWEQRKSRDQGFGLEIVGRIVCNAFSNNSIPFELVAYLSKTRSRVEVDTDFVKEKIRPHFPRCMTSTRFDGSSTW